MQTTTPQEIDRIRGIIRWNWAIAGLLVLLSILLVHQIWVASVLPEVNAGTVVTLNLEGDGVVAQSHDLNLKNINAQQTVVLTELNTKSGAPVAVKVATDTVDKGEGYVAENDQ